MQSLHRHRATAKFIASAGFLTRAKKESQMAQVRKLAPAEAGLHLCAI